MISIIANRTRNLSNKPYIFFLGNALIFVAVLTILHTLSYKGMNFVPETDTNISAQFWIASRYLLAITFLLAIFFIKKKLKINLIIIAVYFFITSFVIASIF
jgi:hypothetical protein